MRDSTVAILLGGTALAVSGLVLGIQAKHEIKHCMHKIANCMNDCGNGDCEIGEIHIIHVPSNDCKKEDSQEADIVVKQDNVE